MEREIIKLKALDYLAIVCPDVLENEVDSFSFDEEYEEYFDFDEEEYFYTNQLWEDFEVIEEEISDVDLEDSYLEKTVVVKRLSDEKYFEGTYREEYSELITHINDKTFYELTEVFPREVKILIFE